MLIAFIAYLLARSLIKYGSRSEELIKLLLSNRNSYWQLLKFAISCIQNLLVINKLQKIIPPKSLIAINGINDIIDHLFAYGL